MSAIVSGHELGRQVQPDPQGATSYISSGSLIAWETMTDVRLKEDTITLVAGYGAARAEHVVLIVMKQTSTAIPANLAGELQRVELPG